MSFILDALKKLEEKRQNESVPDLMTVHSASKEEKRKHRLLPYLILIALLFNGLALFLFFRPSQTAHTPITTHAAKKDIQPTSPSVKETRQPVTETPTLENTPMENSIETLPPLTEKEESTLIPPSPEILAALRAKIKEEREMIAGDPIPEAVDESITGQLSERSVIDFGQLPRDKRNGLPDLTIKGHIYSNDPASRLVNINGNIVREGDMITQGLTIDEITISGVVFNYDGLFFSIRAF